ncbi:MAG: acetate--CoA ligase family protein [Pseudomonadota bacterium]
MDGAARTGLDRLLRPGSVAVIGGGTWCANVIDKCRSIGFEGPIWPVHPKRETVGGIAAVARVEDLPGVPDAAFVGVNRDATIPAVRALARRGAGGAVCFASGFREAEAETGDGAARQAALLEAAGAMTLLGPNCYGFVNYLDGVALWPDIHGGARCDGGVAIVSQSSNIAINLTMQTRGLPMAYMVTCGNQAQTDLSAISAALLADPRVTALGLYVEGIADLRAFEALAAEAREAGKPVVALKVGRSEQAQAATVSHTASLAGGAAGAAALLRRLGIGQVSSLPALLEVLKLLHAGGPLPSARFATMSSSGGEASLMADTAHGRGVVLPPLAAGQTEALRAALGARVALANPLDYHTYVWGDEDAMAEAFAAMMLGDLAIGCVVLDFPRADRCAAPDWALVVNAVARAQAATGKRMGVLSSLGETMPEDVARDLIARGIVPLVGFAEAVEAIEVAAHLGRTGKAPVPVHLPPPAASGRVLTEAEAKAALAAHGLACPRSVRVAGAEAATEAAARVGFPVALKGEGIAHKTEAGAVALNLLDGESALRAARAMPAGAFLVEEMVGDAVAELLIGVTADPAHGYVLTLAAGGTLTELMRDGASLLLPAPRDEVRKALMGLRIAPLLHGYRGGPAADIDAILDAVAAVGAFVAQARPLEVEINPLLCGPTRAVAADALIRLRD